MTRSTKFEFCGGRGLLPVPLVLFLVLGIALYAQAQQLVDNTGNAQLHVANAEKRINLVPDLNLDAKATALSEAINSPYVEIKPAMSPGGDRLYFSRYQHPGNTGGENDNEDIWYCNYDSTTREWAEPVRLPGFLNNDGPNFITNVSVTGDTVALGNRYLPNGKMRAGVSYSVNENGKWSFPIPIIVKNDYNMSPHAGYFVSLKHAVLISAIQRGDSFGSRDLYVSFWNGEYCSEPLNMGNTINTEFEEAAPHLAADGKSLYFASKGHSGYGGYDIYVTRRLDDSWVNWSKPQNLGPVVNGPLDDEFFIITHSGKCALFSKQVTVHNVDLFQIPMAELFNEKDITRGGAIAKRMEAVIKD